MEAQKVGVKRKLLPSPTTNSMEPKSKHSAPTFDAAAGNSLGPCRGQAVYVYNTEETWREAMVTDVDPTKDVITVTVEGTDQTVKCCASHVLLCSEKAMDELTNLTQVTPVHEASVLACLRERFSQGHYYTNAGATVVAVNPFTDVSYLYSLAQIQAYHTREQDLPPHIYPVAETAYRNLVRELGKVNQTIIISGESGAGKTVSAKHLLRYLTIITNPATEPRSSSTGDKAGKIEQRILNSNPILEAFGNAATPRNNNSSRFGKFIELQFLRMGQIQGGDIQTYLLEKTRVMHQGQDENNFHVFYQMTGLDKEEQDYPDWLKDIRLEVSDNTFTCVPYHQDCSENGDIKETLDAMTNIGLCQNKQKQIFQILLAILHLGNICFVQVSDDLDSSDLDSSLMSERALERSCQLLGLNPGHLRRTLLNRSFQAGGRCRQSIFVKPIGIAEARSRRDCLAMLLYSRLFEWLVQFINNQIKSNSFQNVIGLLDIYGFEIFTFNSLEQLCINYANERLQQHYVAHFLENLQKEYSEECLEWVPVSYNDNRPCINILDGRASVFSLLNEEVYLNRKSDDEALKDRLLKLCASSQNCLRPADPLAAEHPSFIIQHYAGEVQYAIPGLVTKNKDDIPADLISLLKASNNSFVDQLFASYYEAESPSGRKKKTVLTKFKSSLDDLMATVVQSDIHYIRCLKPNDTSTPGVFHAACVLRQLRACGTIETVDICRRGYPARLPYSEFQQRYSILLKDRGERSVPEDGLPVADDEAEEKENMCDPLDLLLRQQLDLPVSPKRTPTPRKKLRRRTGMTQHDHARKVCATILQTVMGHKGDIDLQHQFGRTKLFLTEQQLEQLERARLEVFNRKAVLLQSAWRGLCCRRHYKRVMAARRISLAWLTFQTRRHFKRVMAARRISSAWLTFRTRRQFLSWRWAAVILQRGIRRWLHKLHLQRQNDLNQVNSEVNCPPFMDSTSSASGDVLSTPDSPTTTSAIGSMSPSLESSVGLPESFPWPPQDGNVSDDSGVMMQELNQPRPRRGKMGQSHCRREEEASEPRQRPRVLVAQFPHLQGVHVGDGVVTRRRVPKFGARFHTRPSVLLYGHWTNKRDLPSGVADALLYSDEHPYGGCAEGSSVDP